MNTVVDRFEKDTQLILRLMSMGGICMDTETDWFEEELQLITEVNGCREKAPWILRFMGVGSNPHGY